MARFESLYKDIYNNIDLRSLDLNDTVIYANYFDIVNDAKINNFKFFLYMANQIGCKPISDINLETVNKKNTIVYHNTTIPGYENINEYLKDLTPVEEIQEYVKQFIEENNINLKIYGVHARATDFVNSSFDVYKQTVDRIVFNDKFSKIYFCSDSPEWETTIQNLYPDNIIIRKKEDNVKKMSINDSWINNAYTSETAVIEGLKDIMILSKTNFVYYDPNSTFAILAKRLQS